VDCGSDDGSLANAARECRLEKTSIACPESGTGVEAGRGKQVKIDMADPDAEPPLIVEKSHDHGIAMTI